MQWAYSIHNNSLTSLELLCKVNVFVLASDNFKSQSLHPHINMVNLLPNNFTVQNNNIYNGKYEKMFNK